MRRLVRWLCVLLLVAFALFVGLAAVAFQDLFMGILAVVILVWAVWFARAREEAVFRKGPAWIAMEQARARRREIAQSVPVKAVLVTAGMGQKNRAVDGAAGYIVGGSVGMLAGLMGSKPKDRAVFYVTWSDGRHTTEKTMIGSQDFLRYMALTEQ